VAPDPQSGHPTFVWRLDFGFFGTDSGKGSKRICYRLQTPTTTLAAGLDCFTNELAGVDSPLHMITRRIVMYAAEPDDSAGSTTPKAR